MKHRKPSSADTWQAVPASYISKEVLLFIQSCEINLGIQEAGKLVLPHLLRHGYIPPLKNTVTKHV